MRISDVLRSKGSNVITIGPDRTVLDVVRTLVRHNIGATVVVEDGRPVGIVSERDILKLTARGPDALASIRVRALMTRELVTSEPDDDLDHVMNLMTNHRVRHLPILADGELVGIVSIGDVVNRLRSESDEANRHLMSYIAGR
ncbi:MAG: CBS domain-containing protein [Gemmatimonadota bacterium]